MVKPFMIALIVMLVAAESVAASPPPWAKGLQACGEGIGQSAETGDLIVLSDATRVRLASVKAPELWPEGAAYKSWPHAGTARRALAALIKDLPLALYCDGKRQNRRGETVAHMTIAGEEWLQEVLVYSGHVMVMPDAGGRMDPGALYAAEDQARAAKHGLWRFDAMQPVQALTDTGESAARAGWFQIVQGRVIKADRVGKTVYLNFGDDWKRDFTIEVPGKVQRAFARMGLDPLGFAGKTLEARGWLDWKAGPRLLLETPSQIRLLPPPSEGSSIKSE